MFRCGPDSGRGSNRVSGSVVFSLQTPGGLAEGIFYESSLAIGSLCEFFEKKNYLTVWFFIFCLF